MLLALSGLSVAAVAQNTTEVTEEVLEVVEVRQDKYAVVTNPFWDNWFVSFGYGATVLFGDYDAAGSFGKRISPTLNVAVGKWFTPGMGARLQYSGCRHAVMFLLRDLITRLVPCRTVATISNASIT